MATRQETQDAYRAGRLLRMSGKPKSAIEYGNDEMCLRHWCLAGWNDKDIEMNKD